MGITTFNRVHGMGIEGWVGEGLTDSIKTFSGINGISHHYFRPWRKTGVVYRIKNGRPFSLQLNVYKEKFGTGCSHGEPSGCNPWSPDQLAVNPALVTIRVLDMNPVFLAFQHFKRDPFFRRKHNVKLSTRTGTDITVIFF
jgi:hypothetical protein